MIIDKKSTKRKRWHTAASLQIASAEDEPMPSTHQSSQEPQSASSHEPASLQSEEPEPEPPQEELVAYTPPDMKRVGDKSLFTCKYDGCTFSVHESSRNRCRAYIQHLATAHAEYVNGVLTLGILRFDTIGKQERTRKYELQRLEKDVDPAVVSHGDLWCMICGWKTQKGRFTIETRKEYVYKHYALFHAPIHEMDEELYDGVRCIGKMGGAYMINKGEETRAVLACKCGKVGNTNDATKKPVTMF
jgi:hypothetical protein